MTIETKYNIGDEVWFMYRDIPIKDKIIRITINIIKNDVCLLYETARFVFSESDLFPTKEELLKSL